MKDSTISWREQTLTNGDHALFYCEAGSGDALVFLHGGPGDSHEYLRPIAAAFVKSNRCILFDQRGAGRSRIPSYDANQLNYREILNDIDRLLDSLQISQANFIGHSWGAMLGLLYAESRPERVSKMVLIGLGPLGQEMESIYSANFSRLFTQEETVEMSKLRVQRKQSAQLGQHALSMKAHSELVRRFYARVWIYQDAVRAKFIEEYDDDEGFDKGAGDMIWSSIQGVDWPSIVSRIKSPVLIQYGQQDIEPVTQAFNLEKRLSRCELHLINHCGHLPWLDQPQESISKITEFITKPFPDPRSPKLILVVGLPGSGKSSLAKRLAKDLDLPLISKDEIKEALFDSLGWKDREWSKNLGGASFDLLYLFIEKSLSAGNTIIVDAFFSNPAQAESRLLNIMDRFPCHILQINLVCKGDVLLERFRARGLDGTRHRGHVDTTNIDEFSPMLLKGRADPLNLPGTVVEIDTSNFDAISYADFKNQIRSDVHNTPATFLPNERINSL